MIIHDWVRDDEGSVASEEELRMRALGGRERGEEGE